MKNNFQIHLRYLLAPFRKYHPLTIMLSGRFCISPVFPCKRGCNSVGKRV